MQVEYIIETYDIYGHIHMRNRQPRTPPFNDDFYTPPSAFEHRTGRPLCPFCPPRYHANSTYLPFQRLQKPDPSRAYTTVHFSSFVRTLFGPPTMKVEDRARCILSTVSYTCVRRPVFLQQATTYSSSICC